MREINETTEQVIGASVKAHTELGPGLLGPAYPECLFLELTAEGFKVEKEKPLPLVHKECGYRVDLPVENKVVVALKSVEMPPDVHIAKVLAYLKRSNKKTGLLINFHVFRLKEGIKRLINEYCHSSAYSPSKTRIFSVAPKRL